jgi:hypothetical protein
MIYRKKQNVLKCVHIVLGSTWLWVLGTASLIFAIWNAKMTSIFFPVIPAGTGRQYYMPTASTPVASIIKFHAIAIWYLRLTDPARGWPDLILPGKGFQKYPKMTHLCFHHRSLFVLTVTSPPAFTISFFILMLGMWIVLCFFGIGCRSWTIGDDRLTLNVTHIDILCSIGSILTLSK